MDEFVITAALMKLGYAGAAILMVVLLSRWLDRRASAKFADTMSIMRRDARSTAIYFGLRFLALCILAGLVIGCTPAASTTFSTKYDREIKGAAETYWVDYPFWRAWKAQMYQESRLDPAAVSPVGALGLAQFMPGTWEQVQRELRLGAVSANQDVAIQAGAYYMRKLRRSWSTPRSNEDRQRLAQASYNAGLGNLLAAQRLCGGAAPYAAIMVCLPRVTGRYAVETIEYVSRIAKWRAMMETGL